MTENVAPVQVDGDAHQRIVTGFRNPKDAWRSMAWLSEGEQAKWAIHNTRFDARASRNAPFLRFAEEYALYSRSIDGRGSQQGAHVAAMRVAASEGILDKLVGRPDAPQAPPEGQLPQPQKKRWWGG